ncbi:MAG: hypothetical protein LBD24_05000, partial [Spirochaetaceae bacterium]|nr:hypothetical protein [Spirochaetaceae bacterium]
MVGETVYMIDVRCPRCGETVPDETFAAYHKVCGACGYHARLSWKERLAFIADKETFAPFDAQMESKN